MNVNVEHRIILDQFEPRPYQQELFDAVDAGYKKILLVWPRRSGKDYSCFQLAIRQCIKEVCLVQYVFPTFGGARRSIWQAIDMDGNTFLSTIPSDLILKMNDSEMFILFKNGSRLQLIGGDVHDKTIRGTNPKMVILSEYAYMHSAEIYETVSPILAANSGTVIINSTPNGKNFFFQLFSIAKELPEWKVLFRTTDQINHIPQEALEQERRHSSPEKFEQEYNCSFSRGVMGSILGRSVHDLYERGQITSVPHEPGLLTHLAMDIGVNDATTIIWFQVVADGAVIRIIDCLSNNNVGLDFYAVKIQQRGENYRYGKMFAPHDIEVREFSDGQTRLSKARALDIPLETLPQMGIEDSIENVLTHIPKFWIDANKCKPLIDAMENYYKEWDEVRNMYHPKPAKSWANHYCDALRYMCQAIYRTKKGLTGEEYDMIRAKHLYGPNRLRNNIFGYNPKYDG